MSWKHAKFEDSTVFRSLEKIAQEKGLVKNTEVVKTAAKTLDLTPSSNLTDNIIKLCAGLRAQGMSKFAEDLELKFINYKKAQTLYETFKETGEDLVDQAHPKGSHKLEGVDGDATVETIVDRHLKMLDVVNKTPKGKLASNHQIINAVKMALGQVVDSEANQTAKDAYSEAIKLMVPSLQKIVDLYNKTSWWGARNQFSGFISVLNGLQKDIDAVDVNAGFPTDLPGKIAGAIFNAAEKTKSDKNWLATNSAANNEEKQKQNIDQAFINAYNAAAANVLRAQSLSWAGGNALNGNLGDLEYRRKLLNPDDIKNVIVIRLLRPLGKIKTDVANMNYGERKSKLPTNANGVNRKELADKVIGEIDSSITSATNAYKAVDGKKDGMGLVSADVLGGLFAAPITQIKNVKSLEDLSAKCDKVVAMYRKNLGIIEDWLTEAGSPAPNVEE
jgi:hypothetical protein